MSQKQIVRKKRQNSGQVLIELILAITLATIVLGSIAVTIISIREALSRNDKQLNAKLLLQKETEAIRSVKESAWNTISTDGTYHVVAPNPPITNNWTVAGSSILENGFTRSFVVSSVCRASSTALLSACGPATKIDPSTKLVTVSITWTSLGTYSVSDSFYISRNYNSQAWIQTLSADFNPGIKSGTTVVSNFGGEVELAPTATPNWKIPGAPVSQNIPINEDTNDVYVVGNRAYVVGNSRNNAGTCGTCEIIIYDVTIPSSPAFLGGRDLGANAFAVVVSGNFAYIATAQNSTELTIVNVSNPAAPTIAGSYNAPTNADGRGIAVVGTTTYLVTDNNTTAPGAELYVLNVSNPAAPALVSATSYRDLGASARDIVVSGNYAYIASTHDTQELQIVNISNPNSLPAPVTYDIPSSAADALSVYVSGATVYLGAGNNLYLLNFTAPSTISPVSTYSAGGVVNGVFVLGNLAFLATSNTASDFQIVNLCNPSSPVLLGSVNLADIAWGVYVVGNYAYLATADNAGEFKVIQGGPTYPTNGTFESTSSPTSSIVGFNYLDWNWSSGYIPPICTSISFQISTSSNGSTWTSFVGPDGLTTSSFVSGGAIPLDFVASRNIKYRATLNGDGNNTPRVEEVLINYSQ